VKVKANVVELFDGSNNHKQEFDINHAERLLRMPNNGGWTLPDDSPYQFEQNNGITIKQSVGTSKSPEKSEVSN